MKKLIALIVVILPGICAAQFTFHIQGKVHEGFRYKKLILEVRDGYSQSRDTKVFEANIAGNRFSIAGVISKPCEHAFLYTAGREFQYGFVLDSGFNSLTVNKVPANSPTYKNPISHIDFDTSLSKRMYRAINKMRVDFYFKYGQISAGPIAEVEKLRRRELEYISRYPDNFFSLIHLYSLSNLFRTVPPAEVLKVLDKLDPEISGLPLGKELRQRMENSQSSYAGRPAPRFSAETIDGADFENTSLTGRPYLIAFGATWCKPCIGNYPKLKALYEKYKNQGFEIVSINLDENEQKWRQLAKVHQLTWINVSELVKWEDSQIGKQFNVTGVPFYIIVGKDGLVVYNSYQAGDLDNHPLEKFIAAAVK